MTSQAQMVAEELGVSARRRSTWCSATPIAARGTCGTFGSLTTRHVRPRAPRRGRRGATGAARPRGREARRRARPARGGKRRRLGHRAHRAQGHLRRARRGQAHRPAGGREGGAPRRRRSSRSWAAHRGGSTGPTRSPARAMYAADIRPPGMLYARLLRPPAHGATLKALDAAAAEKRPGVTLVRRDDLVAVLHADPEAAAAALELLRADWSVPPPGPDDETIFEHLVKAGGAPQEKESRGDLAAGRARAARVAADDVPQGLRGARADGAARRGRRARRTGGSRCGPRRRRRSRRATASRRRWVSTRRTSASSLRTSAADSAARAPIFRRSRPRGSRRSRASRCRSRGRAPRSSSTTVRSGGGRRDRRRASTPAGAIVFWDCDGLRGRRARRDAASTTCRTCACRSTGRMSYGDGTSSVHPLRGRPVARAGREHERVRHASRRST